jgi:hypothetical protein
LNDLISFFAINVVGAAIFLPLHVVVIRAMHGRNLITTINLVIAISTIVAVAVGWWGLSFSSESARLMGCFAGGLTCLAYAGLYGLLGPSSVDRSVSAHIVELVYLAPEGRLKEADLFRLYTHDDVLGKRFTDCIDTGIIERSGDELVVTRRGARIAALYIFIGTFLGMQLWFLERHRARAAPK